MACTYMHAQFTSYFLQDADGQDLPWSMGVDQWQIQHQTDITRDPTTVAIHVNESSIRDMSIEDLSILDTLLQQVLQMHKLYCIACVWVGDYFKLGQHS